MSDNKKKSCFVISPIGSEGSPIRNQSDLIFKYVIEPTTMKCGYEKPLRSDKDFNSSIITTMIIQHIRNDDLVIAVLTGSNPNVFYELSIRHAIMKPCIHLIDETSWPPPFDVSAMNIIRYDLSDWSSREKASEDLFNYIKISEEAKITVNPISSALAVEKSIINEDVGTKNIAILIEQMQQALYESRQIASNLQRYINLAASTPNNGLTISDSYHPLGAATVSPTFHNAQSYLRVEPTEIRTLGDIGSISSQGKSSR